MFANAEFVTGRRMRGIGVALWLVLCFAPVAAHAQSDTGGASAIIKIAADTSLPVSRRATLGTNKAMIIELPVDAQDAIISQPNIVDASVLTARRVLIFAKTAGEANIFLLGRDGRKILILDLIVKRDVGDLANTLHKLLPGSRIKISASGDGVVLSGTVAQPADASRAEEIATQHLVNASAKVVNLITAGAKEQVLLKITVAELQREAIRRIGVDLPQAIAKAGTFTFTKVMQNGFPVTTATATAAQFVAPGSPATVAAGSALQATKTWGSGSSASAILEAFERAGLARTLAEPTLIAISGETAKFLAGGEFPVPVAQQNNTVSVSWKSFGVNVAFTPFVLSEGRISLKVAAEVSELSSQGAVQLQSLSIPAVQVRRAETVMEMPSGSSLAMAGLLSEQTRQNIDGVPELRNLPVLGALFRSKEYQNNQSELVILVTPHIIRPTDKRDLSRPDEGFAPASPLRGLLLGQLNRVYGDVPSRLTASEFGFIVDYPDHGGVKD